MTRMDALQIIKEELYKDTVPRVEVQNALDYLKNIHAIVTSEALVNVRKNTLKEFVEWLKAKYEGKVDKQAETYQYFCKNGFSTQSCEYHRGKLTEIEDLADELDGDLEKFLEERK